MARRYYDPRERDDERRYLSDEDRRYARGRDEDDEQDAREMRYAYGRYSGSDQAEDRRRLEGGRPGGARYHHGVGSHGGGMERRGGYGEEGYGRRREEDDRRRDSPYPMGFGAADPARSGGPRREIDEPGRYYGVGPKGYMRSDERIREDVCDRLADDPHLDASNIDITVKDREVTLAGTVSHRSEKRRVEDLVEHISGVKDVQNNLRVQSERST